MSVDYSILRLSSQGRDRTLDIYSFLQVLDTHCIPSVSGMTNGRIMSYAEKLSLHSEVLFVDVMGECVGMSAMYANDSESCRAYLSLIGLLPQYQGIGIATELFVRCFDLAVEKGMASMELHVLSNHSRAIRLYSNVGFRILDDSSDRMHMIRKLSSGKY